MSSKILKFVNRITFTKQAAKLSCLFVEVKFIKEVQAWKD